MVGYCKIYCFSFVSFRLASSHDAGQEKKIKDEYVVMCVRARESRERLTRRTREEASRARFPPLTSALSFPLFLYPERSLLYVSLDCTVRLLFACQRPPLRYRLLLWYF